MKNMKFNILLAALLLMGGWKMQAQEYLPMVQEGNEWHTFYLEYYGYINYSNYVFRCSGDTLIEDVRYVKLMKTRDGDEPRLFSLLKEADGKVWARYFFNDPRELLLYDFTANVVDVLIVGYPWNHYVVDSISTEHIGGFDRKKLWLVTYDNLGNPHLRETWMEGIGSNLGLPWSGWGVGVSDFFSCLLCFHQKGELVWQNPEYNTCTYPYDAVEENKDSEISIYPNPGNNTLNICTTLQNACVEVYDMNGRLVYSQEITENTTAINAKNWSDGIYLWKVISDGKEVESGKWIKE